MHALTIHDEAAAEASASGVAGANLVTRHALDAGEVAWRRGEGAGGGAASAERLRRRETGGAGDVFIVVEDGVVEVTLAEPRGATRVRTLWPGDFFFCNSRPGAPGFLANVREDRFTQDAVCLTPAQLTVVPADVFLQAINQPAMAVLKHYLIEHALEADTD